MRLENKHTLCSEAKQWCYLNKFLMRTSEVKFEFRKIVHLIEQSEMMVLPKYFLAKMSEAKFEFRKIAHIDYIIFLWRG